MKIILIIGLVITAIITIALIVPVFTQDKYTIIRETIINKPKQMVFDYIRFNRNQKYYSKWIMLDPDTKLEFKGAEDGTAWAIMAFKSKNEKAGTGEWELKNVTNGQRIDFELHFLAPYVFHASGYMTTEAVSADQTKLIWVYNGGMPWPKNIMLLFINIDKIIGTDMAESLGNIKRILEND